MRIILSKLRQFSFEEWLIIAAITAAFAALMFFAFLLTSDPRVWH